MIDSNQISSQSLHPFGADSVLSRLQLRFSVHRHPQKIEFLFTLSGASESEIERLRVPPLLEEPLRARRDELWKHTCLEVFVGEAGGSSYLEMNLSPAGEWNMYAFDSYRSGMRVVSDASAPLVSVEVSKARDSITWCGCLRAATSNSTSGELASLLGSVSLVMGATAVLEYQNGEREYWALAHMGEKPDFHLRDSFCLKL